MRFGVKSDKGVVRDKNEDSYNIIAGYSGVPVSFIIADGMGGHNSGEVASKMAVDYVSRHILENPDKYTDEAEMLDSLKDIMEKANSEIYRSSRLNKKNFGMGTTLIVAVIANKKLYIGHVGDSRVYILRDGVIERITTDHSYVEELVRTGSIKREDAGSHPQKNIITRALGCAEEIKVDLYDCNVKENDIFVLCTDGLTNLLGDEEIEDMTKKIDDPGVLCDKLVETANGRGGEDNITVIVFKNN